jgi:hypothetical protein
MQDTITKETNLQCICSLVELDSVDIINEKKVTLQNQMEVTIQVYPVYCMSRLCVTEIPTCFSLT